MQGETEAKRWAVGGVKGVSTKETAIGGRGDEVKAGGGAEGVENGVKGEKRDDSVELKAEGEVQAGL